MGGFGQISPRKKSSFVSGHHGTMIGLNPVEPFPLWPSGLIGVEICLPTKICRELPKFG